MFIYSIHNWYSVGDPITKRLINNKVSKYSTIKNLTTIRVVVLVRKRPVIFGRP